MAVLELSKTATAATVDQYHQLEDATNKVLTEMKRAINQNSNTFAKVLKGHESEMDYIHEEIAVIKRTIWRRGGKARI